MEIGGAPSEGSELAKVVFSQSAKRRAAWTKMHQEGDKVEKLLPNKRETRFCRFRISQPLQMPNDDKIKKYLSTEVQIKGTARKE